MSRQVRANIIQIIVFIGIAVTLIWWQFSAMTAEQKAEMSEAISQVNWWYSFPILIVGFLSHFFRAMRWRQLLSPININVSKTNITLSVLIGYFANALVPRLGEIAKCSVLAKYEKVPVDKLIGTIIAERAFDLLCLILLFAFSIATQYGIIAPYAKELTLQLMYNEQGELNVGRITIIIIIGLLLLLSGIFILRRIKHTKLGKFFYSIIEGLKAFAKIEHKGKFILNTLLIWAMYVAMVIIGFKAMPATSHLPIISAFVIVAFGSIAMILTPGGIGAYPPIVASILLLYGISLPIGNAFGWVSWGAQTGIVIIFGLISLIALPLVNRKTQKNI